MIRLRYGAATDVGVVRSNNEDQLLVTGTLFAVADGMGGHAAGEVASLAAVEALRAEFDRGPHTVESLIEAVRVANREVWDRAAEDETLRGMGTTITVVALVEADGEEHVAIANVGDSRAYLLRDGELGMLTDDHSVAEQLVREGRLTPEEAAIHPQRHVLTRVLGMAPEVEVDCYPILPYRGDRFLLCSDGLINEVSDSQIASVLRRLADPDEAVTELVAMARANGGHDNITVVLVDVEDDDHRAETASAALADEAPAAGGGTLLIEPPPELDPDPPAEPSPPVAPAALADEPADTDEPGEEVPAAVAPPRGHRMTLRVLVFLVLLILVLAGAAAAIGFYARGTYYVGIDKGQVTIFKGRPGGLLWFHPTVRSHTDLAAADVPPLFSDDVRSGKEETTLASARRYVDRIRAERDRLAAAQGTVPPAPETSTTLAPPGAVTTVPATTTTGPSVP